MPRFKLYIEFEGTRYSGWQVQKGQRTIQGEMYQACEIVFRGEKCEVYGSGRTDAGVHSLEQVAHLEVRTTLSPIKIRQKLNDHLPYDISVLRVEPAHPRFHARHDAVARSYVYVISRRKTAFGKSMVWWVKDALNEKTLQAAGRMLEGFQDFRVFTDDDPDEKSTLVDLKFIDVHTYGDTIVIHLVGSHFLWKMVRRIIGVLVECARGHLEVSTLKEVLWHTPFPVAKYTAPPSGLYLEKVYYEETNIRRGEGAFRLPFTV